MAGSSPPVGGNLKSHVSDLLKLAITIYKDAMAKCTAVSPDSRDVDTMTSRVKHEGLSFLTITLPSLGEDFERSLDLGFVAPTQFRSFRKRGTIPAFLQGMFGLVFDMDTGRILYEPDVAAIEGIRQVAYTFKKLKVACTDQRVSAAINGFVQCEHELERDLVQEDLSYFTEVRRAIWVNILSNDSLRDTTQFIPRHGPGATADRIGGNRKFKFSRWHSRLEPYFPIDSFAFNSLNAIESKEFEKLECLPYEQEQPVRVITVPKTLKKPRIIAIEPVCMQYTQQAIARELISLLEKHPFTRGHINFSDQSVNRELAMSSSITGKLATLDLSAASDRVPLSLVSAMFECNPELQGAILACRSRRAELPGGEVIHLRKFASMGSALCFPIEAMYFYTICIGALLKKHNLPVTYQNAYMVSRNVYVYGDDIIVPNNDADVVAEHLQKYYCKVNTAKSFWKGKFRESCGMDAYDGEEVTPTYIRHCIPRNKQLAHAFVSLVEASNHFHRRGYWQTAAHLHKVLQKTFGYIPIVSDKCEGIGMVSHFMRTGTGGKTRWNPELQRLEVQTLKAAPVYQKDKLDGYPALLKCLLSLESRSSSDDFTVNEHLTRTARHGAVTLKRRWVLP